MQTDKLIRFIRLPILVVFLMNWISSPAQEIKVVRDLQLWTGVKLEKSFAKDWTLSLEEELRLKQNMSRVNNYFTEIGLRYKINKNFSLGGGFRYIRDKDQDGSYEGLSRYNLELRYRNKISLLDFNYRLKYQKEVEGTEVFDLNAYYEKQLRNRFTFSINNLNRIEPYFSTELFQVFVPYAGPEFKYCRILAGIQYEPGNFGEFKAAFGIDRELSSTVPASIYLLKINYTLEL